MICRREAMAYSRFWDSDIYIYPSVLGDIVCSGCFIYNQSFNITDDAQLLAHIKEHRDQGHQVPDDLEEEILRDPDRYGILEQ